jgi:hypothetical protein
VTLRSSGLKAFLEELIGEKPRSLLEDLPFVRDACVECSFKDLNAVPGLTALFQGIIGGTPRPASEYYSDLYFAIAKRSEEGDAALNEKLQCLDNHATVAMSQRQVNGLDTLSTRHISVKVVARYFFRNFLIVGLIQPTEIPRK